MCCDFYERVMGQPTITRAAGTAAGSGDNTLVAAPATGVKLVILYLQVQNESAVATTAQLKFGTVVVARNLAQTQGYSFGRDYNQYPMILPAATALVLNLSGANSHGYTVEYTTI